MQHILSRWMWPLMVVLPLIARSWGLFVLLIGFIICSQSVHESIHHKDRLSAKVIVRIVGALIALLGAYLMR